MRSSGCRAFAGGRGRGRGALGAADGTGGELCVPSVGGRTRDGWGALGAEHMREDPAVDENSGCRAFARENVAVDGTVRSWVPSVREDAAVDGELWVPSVCGRTWLGAERSREDMAVDGTVRSSGCGALAGGRCRGRVKSSECRAFADVAVDGTGGELWVPSVGWRTRPWTGTDREL